MKKKVTNNFQVAVVRCLNRNNIFHFAIPKCGFNDNVPVDFFSKSMGYVKGAPDIVVLLNGKCIFIELINGYNGYQTIEQKKFQNTVEQLGFEYLLWGEIIDCELFVKKYNGVVK